MDFTLPMVKKLFDSYHSTLGTPENTQYMMETDCKIKNKQTYHFIGYYIPNKEGKIKTVKGETFIYCDEGYCTTRYKVNPFVAELFNFNY